MSCCPRWASSPSWCSSSGRWSRSSPRPAPTSRRAERAFVGWMAPRGIVAAATASTYSSSLVAKGIGGASKILPATFLVIVSTVTLYGLTALPVARLLRVIRHGPLAPAAGRRRPVGGGSWEGRCGPSGWRCWCGQGAKSSATASARRAWSWRQANCSRRIGPGGANGGVTEVLLLTDEDDFNALLSHDAAAAAWTGVYRLGPPAGSHGVVAPYTGGEILFGAELGRSEMARRYQAGARIAVRAPGSTFPAGARCVVLGARGRSTRARDGRRPLNGLSGDSMVLLCPSGEQRLGLGRAGHASTVARVTPGDPPPGVACTTTTSQCSGASRRGTPRYWTESCRR